MQDWKVMMWLRRRAAMRAGSGECSAFEGLEKAMGLVVEAAVVSRPAVKARGPAPERIMARVEGSLERWLKIVGSSSHMLYE